MARLRPPMAISELLRVILLRAAMDANGTVVLRGTMLGQARDEADRSYGWTAPTAR